MRLKILILALVLALILAAAGVALANGVEMSRWVLGGGASDSAGGGVSLRATFGQPVVGVITGGDTTIGQGFWGGVAWYHVYLPLVVRNY